MCPAQDSLDSRTPSSTSRAGDTSSSMTSTRLVQEITEQTETLNVLCQQLQDYLEKVTECLSSSIPPNTDTILSALRLSLRVNGALLSSSANLFTLVSTVARRLDSLESRMNTNNSFISALQTQDSNRLEKYSASMPRGSPNYRDTSIPTTTMDTDQSLKPTEVEKCRYCGKTITPEAQRMMNSLECSHCREQWEHDNRGLQ